MRDSLTMGCIEANNKWPITNRERHVLCLISEGYSSSEIANSLFLSFETIKSHRKNLMRKLNVPNTAALITASFKRGILPLN